MFSIFLLAMFFTYSGSVVFCPSYDCRVYALDFKNKVHLWTCRLPAPITSTPCLISSASVHTETVSEQEFPIIICADLSGQISTLNGDTGVILGSLQLKKPVFADLIAIKQGKNDFLTTKFCVSLTSFWESSQKILLRDSARKF